MSRMIPFADRDKFSNAVKTERVTPQSLEAEQATLGAMLMERDALAVALELVSSDDFYREIHRKIYTAMETIFHKRGPVDLITIVEELRRQSSLDECGGTAYISALIESCPSSAAVGSYAKAVKESSQRRALLRFCETVSAAAYDNEVPAQVAIDEANQMLFGLATHSDTGEGFTHAGVDAMEAVEYFKARKASPGHLVGLSTGLKAIDNLTGGLMPTEMTIIAAKTGIGKTALAVQIALHAATGGRGRGGLIFDPVNVALVSLEMSKPMLARRYVAHLANANAKDLARGFASDEEIERAEYAAAKVVDSHFFVMDERNLSVAQIETRLRRLAMQQKKMGLVVVDYMALAKANGKHQSKVQELAEIGKALRFMAKEFDCPFVVLSQINRNADNRADQRPSLSDIRDSGTIAEDADNVWIMHRPKFDGQFPPEIQETELNVEKARNGPTGNLKLSWSGKTTTFHDVEKVEFEHYANRI